MKKNTVLIILLFTLFSFVNAAEIKVNIVPGEYWKKRSPQCAVWIENENNEDITTLYVTKSVAKNRFSFAPKEGRPDSLPVWLSVTKSSKEKTKLDDKTLDAVTSATPKQSVTVSKELNLEKGKTYFIKVEVNQSFDYNDYFTKKNSGVNGQPSVIYLGKIVPGEEKQEIELEILGTGSVTGKNGKIYDDNLEELTTAKEIIKNIFVVF